MAERFRGGIPFLWLLTLLLTACSGSGAANTATPTTAPIPLPVTVAPAATRPTDGTATADVKECGAGPCLLPTATPAGGVSDSFTIGGVVQNTTKIGLADLQGLPALTLNAEIRTRQGAQGSHAYKGALLRDVLGKAQPRTDPNRKNDLENRVIAATGSDGYRVAIAYGEIDPDFGAQQIIVAYEVDGKPLGTDGVAELVVPGDKLAGRWIKNLVSLTVADPVPNPIGNPPPPGGPSASFTVGGAVQAPATFALADLQALPATTITAETRTRQGSQGSHSYKGVLLKDLLDKVKVQTDPNRKNDTLAKFVTFVGSDGYRITVASGEFDPDFGNQQLLIAYEMDGKPLAADGVAELIVPNDKLAGRWVKNLVGLSIGTPAS